MENLTGSLNKFITLHYHISSIQFLPISSTLRVAVVGNVDAGKSTLLGVLTHGELDNGRGTARMKLFRHKHEMETGRTSSVGNDILGFDSQGVQGRNGRLRYFLFFIFFPPHSFFYSIHPLRLAWISLSMVV